MEWPVMFNRFCGCHFDKIMYVVCIWIQYIPTSHQSPVVVLAIVKYFSFFLYSGEARR